MKESFTPKRFTAFWLLMLVALCGSLSVTRAQSLTGQITGIVQDEKGAVIPNANVELKNEASGDVRRTVTNDEGYFTFASVQAATYTVNIEATGFSRYSQTGIMFNVGDKITLRDLNLKAGGVGEQVTVVGSQNEIVPVDTGEKSTLISANQIQNIAVVGRNAAELIKILPGFTPITGLNNTGAYTGEVMGINGNGDAGKQSAIGNYSANGGRADSIDIVSDGAHVSDPGCNCATPVNPNTDMVAEFKVLQSNFGAENSKGPTVLNAVSKAGGNEFHGSAYIYARDYHFNANDWQNNKAGVARPKNRFLFPGGNLGGPVLIPGTGFNKKRDKLFFFTGYEYYYQKLDTGLLRSVVPSQAMRNGDYSDTAYLKLLNKASDQIGGNICPDKDAKGNPIALASYCSGPGKLAASAIDPGGKVLTNLFPLPNIDPAANGGYNYGAIVTYKQPSTQFLTRVDYSISDNTKLFVRYNRQRETQPFPVGLWWRNSGQVPYPTPVNGQNLSDSISASLTNVFSPTMTNEVVFGLTHINFPNEFGDPSKVSRKSLGYPYQGIFKGGVDQIPSITTWGQAGTIFNPGGFFSGGKDVGAGGILFAEKYLGTLSDNLTKVYNTHTMKFGVYFEKVTNNQPGNGPSNGQLIPSTWGGNSSGNAYADLLRGVVTQYNEQSPNVLHNEAYNTYEFYGQDSYKVTPRLTLEFGGRFAHLGNWFDREGTGFAVFDQTKYDPKAPRGSLSGVLWHGKDSSVPNAGQPQIGLIFQPRVGFAYDVFGKGKTVLRGGYGQFTYHEAQLTPGLDVAAGVRNVSAPCCSITLAEIDKIDPKTSQSLVDSISAFDPNEKKHPTTHSYSFTIQQRLPFQLTLESSYVGNKSVNQLNNGHTNINVIPFGTIPSTYSDDVTKFRPFPTYGAIDVIRHTSFQNYNSAQFLLSRQTGRLGFMASYTFSKALGIRGGGEGPSADNLDLRGHNYGVLAYDRTNVFSIAYNYFLPDIGKNYMGDNKLARGLFDGWQISGITSLASGPPLQAFNGNFGISGTNATGASLDSQKFTGTPDTTVQPTLLCDPRKGLGKDQYINLSCFGAPATGTNGTYVFPYIKGPAYQNHDISMFKNFNFTETKKLQFRLSGYNVFNHPLKSLIGPNLDLDFDNGKPTADTVARFGKITDNKFGRRIVQFAFKFFF